MGSGLRGLQGLQGDTVIDSVDVTGGTSDHIILDIAREWMLFISLWYNR